MYPNRAPSVFDVLVDTRDIPGFDPDADGRDQVKNHLDQVRFEGIDTVVDLTVHKPAEVRDVYLDRVVGILSALQESERTAQLYDAHGYHITDPDVAATYVRNLEYVALGECYYCSE